MSDPNLMELWVHVGIGRLTVYSLVGMFHSYRYC